jgi:CheY-like chemotaxis protein
MSETYELTGMRILAVDDEPDVLETIVDVLDEADVDTATDYRSGSLKLVQGDYDLAVLDIMGVDGLRLLEEAVDLGVPAVMLTAHALSEETLQQAVKKGAVAYLPKEELVTLDETLKQLIDMGRQGKSPWRVVSSRLGRFFGQHFGPTFTDREEAFWKEVVEVDEKRHGRHLARWAK